MFYAVLCKYKGNKQNKNEEKKLDIGTIGKRTFDNSSLTHSKTVLNRFCSQRRGCNDPSRRYDITTLNRENFNF